MISTLFSSGLHVPAGALLAGWLIAFLIVGSPMLIGLPIIIFSIYIVLGMVP